jgi:hypothetical protein
MFIKNQKWFLARRIIFYFGSLLALIIMLYGSFFGKIAGIILIFISIWINTTRLKCKSCNKSIFQIGQKVNNCLHCGTKYEK